MVKRNKNISKLVGGYLFYEMNKRKIELQKKYPNVKVISLSIGNTSEPLGTHITAGLMNAAQQMSTKEGYSGYWEEQSLKELQEKISEKIYNGIIDPDEVFVSDGSKPDCGRLQIMFGKDATIAVQDPTYPVYVDAGVIIGQTGKKNIKTGQYKGIYYLTCNSDNNFFPDFNEVPRTDIIFFCSPNNPTGAVATKEQLKKLVDFAKKNKSIIVFDAAYSEYISDSSLPKSIFEIKGAHEVAIETSSFSKSIGYCGVRLGWTIVPKKLKYVSGESVHADWLRIMTTIFNGASNILQYGTLNAFDNKGLQEMKAYVSYTMENAKLIKKTIIDLGYESIGGDHSPYIWIKTKGKSSWEFFDEILNKTFIISTPGIGFGPGGEGYVRFSSFGHKEDIKEACRRIRENL